MRRRLFQAMLLAAVLASGALTGLADGQDKDAAHDEGKALGASLADVARTAAQTAPTPDRIPGFGGTPDESTLFDDPDAIAARAAEAARASEGYQAVRSSIAHRPRIAPEEITATVARGKTIAANADQYVGGLDAGGKSGSCRQLPPSDAGGIPYDATCNVGVTLEPGETSCAIPLVVSVTHQTRYLYSCGGGADDCALFEGRSCERIGSHEGPCLQGYEENGHFICTEPGTPVRDLSCPAEVPGATLQGTEVKDVVLDWRDESACAAPAADPSCTDGAETCTSSDPVTRLVDGVEVTRPCWAWSRSYTCQTRVPKQNCDALEANPGCTFAREECLSDETPCPTVERIYHCTARNDQPAAPQYICDGDVYCLGGECETIDRQPNTEFGQAAVALHAAADAEGQFDPATLKLFKGTRETCHSAVFGLLNCCAGKAFPLIPYGQLLVALGCGREEILLHERDNAGLCAYVGSYCATSILGVCLTKKKTYCCFESKLSRILQEQGRPQIGKPWGSAKSERCDGFTANEFARLDLSRMDFSEVYAEFQDAAKLPDELQTSVELQQKISDYYNRAGGQ